MPTEIPVGYCQCGCGQKTTVPKKSNAKEGRVRGVPMRFVSGHNGAHRPFEPLDTRYEVRDGGYETPCWYFLRTKSRKGYGVMWHPQKRRNVPAHVFYYEHYVGLIPVGLQIDHLCRNHPCVNPDHLEPVTQAVNQQRGLNAKLNRDQADEIRRRGLIGREGRRQGRQSGESLAGLAREFGVSQPVIKGIVEGHLWP